MMKNHLHLLFFLLIIHVFSAQILAQSDQNTLSQMEKQVCNMCFSDQRYKVVKIFESSAVVKRGRDYLLINIYGDIIKELGRSDEFKFVSDDGHIVRKVSKYYEDTKYTILDEYGEKICPDYFDDFNYKDGRLIVRKGGDMGIIDKSCMEVIQFQYDELKVMDAETFLAKKNDATFIINSAGEVIKELELDTNDILLNTEGDILRIVCTFESRSNPNPVRQKNNDLFRVPNYTEEGFFGNMLPWKGDDRCAIIVDAEGEVKVDSFPLAKMYIVGGTLNIGRDADSTMFLLSQPFDNNFKPLSKLLSKYPLVQLQNSFGYGIENNFNVLLSAEGDTLIPRSDYSTDYFSEGILFYDGTLQSYYDYNGELIRQKPAEKTYEMFKPTGSSSCNLKNGYVLDPTDRVFDLIDIASGSITLSRDSLQILEKHMSHSLIPARDASGNYDFYTYDGLRVTNIGFGSDMKAVGDYYIVRMEGLKNVINSQGEFMLEESKPGLNYDGYGYYTYTEDGKMKLLDEHFVDVFDSSYHRISVINRDLFAVKEYGKGSWLIDKNEQLVSKGIFENISKVSHGLYKMVDTSSFYYIGTSGEKLHDYNFEIESKLNHNLTKVCAQGKCGILDSKANLLAPLAFDDIEYIQEGRRKNVRLSYNGTWITVDLRGHCRGNCPEEAVLRGWGFPW